MKRESSMMFVHSVRNESDGGDPSVKKSSEGCLGWSCLCGWFGSYGPFSWFGQDRTPTSGINIKSESKTRETGPQNGPVSNTKDLPTGFGGQRLKETRSTREAA